MQAGERLSAGERFRRARRIGLTFGRIYLGIKANQLIARRLAPPDMHLRWSRFNRESAWSIYEAAIELRGLILKGCQFLGARADVIPPEYVEILSSLQDRVPAHDFSVVRECVESELKRPLEAVFAEFSRTPLAAASLAQVHEARLHTGERVAVKVQYPEVAQLVASDVSNLRALFRAVGLFERRVEMMPLIDELAEHVPLELDFLQEGRNAERVAALLTHRRDVAVPRVFWEWSTTRLLVTEFIEGVKISDVKGLRDAGIDREATMRTLIEAYCEQILVHGYFHADPHPGNLIVQPLQAEDAAPGAARVVFIDFGLAKALPDAFREAAMHFAIALLKGEPAAMARALVELGFETERDSEEALREISELILDVARRLRHQTHVDPQVVREAATAIPELIRANPLVHVPTHVVLLGRVFALLSGLGRTLDVRLDMLRLIFPYAVGVPPRPAPEPAAPEPPQ